MVADTHSVKYYGNIQYCARTVGQKTLHVYRVYTVLSYFTHARLYIIGRYHSVL